MRYINILQNIFWFHNNVELVLLSPPRVSYKI